MRLVVLGTSSFACPALFALASRHDIALVVTQPDRPAGRHAELRQCAVKQLALRLGLAVVQPERIQSEASIAALRAAAPEVIVVASYGQLLKREVFSLPPRGTINIHASLLPAYRGAAPVQWSILRGERTTGVTTFLIDEGMDTGDLLLQRAITIGPDETAAELEARLAIAGAELIGETLGRLAAGKLAARPQPSEGISLAPRLSRAHGRIDWTLPARRIHDLVRGMNPWPGAWTMLGCERMKVYRSALTDIECGPIRPGQIGLRETDRLFVGTGDRLIELLEVQRECRPPVGGADFLHGLRDEARFESAPDAG